MVVRRVWWCLMEVVWTLCGGEEGLVVSDGGCVDIVWW